MSWRYDASEEEQRAADLLREKGWTVNAPTCPDCHGFGFVTGWVDTNYAPTTSNTSVTFGQKPCPRGCGVPSVYFASSATGVYP